MSTRASKRPLKGYVRDCRRRKMVLDVDLNVDPQGENRAPEGIAISHGYLPDGQVSMQDGASTSTDGRLHTAPIDVEAIDDEVVISSPRRFTEARNHARRNQVVTVVLDEDSDAQHEQSGSVVEEPATSLTLNGYNNHQSISTNEFVINYDLDILEINLSSKATDMKVMIFQSVRLPRQTKAQIISPTMGPACSESGRRNVLRPNTERQKRAWNAVNPSPEPRPASPPKEPTFTCAVCMGSLVEAMSTVCGHIFCKACIKAAITAQKKCPTCRRKLLMSNIHRIYLPAIN
ncbi:uncharacterized protein LOC131239541 [Magnolia sinica]|uniref:uncharacterized protein LOC131239541 n=1 Tax=Magnolia sinica TaxID=86752 RepID=UPI0026583D7D|nr:uncharacterized protein LOC131239541 [Magnolia sinica]